MGMRGREKKHSHGAKVVVLQWCGPGEQENHCTAHFNESFESKIELLKTKASSPSTLSQSITHLAPPHDLALVLGSLLGGKLYAASAPSAIYSAEATARQASKYTGI